MKKPFYIEFIREMGLQYLGIDVIEFSHSMGMKALIVIYCISLIYLITQRFRRKCYFDYTLCELGTMDLYFLWGFSSFGAMFTVIHESPEIMRYPIAVVVIIAIFGGLFLFLACQPLSFLLECIREYKFSGILYWFALMGIGIVGIVLLLLQYIILILPIVVLLLLFVIGSVWDDHSSVRDDDDEFF